MGVGRSEFCALNVDGRENGHHVYAAKRGTMFVLEL